MPKRLKKIFAFLLSFMFMLQFSFSNIFAETTLNGTTNAYISNDSTGYYTLSQSTSINTTDSGNKIIIYYAKGFSTPYIHYGINGNWTQVPGVKMDDDVEHLGYSKAVINLGDATEAQVTFNDGNGHWDNNGGKNYIFKTGEWTYKSGKITYGQPQSGTAVIYYKKGFSTPYIHYGINGNWTQVPGVKMDDDAEHPGYSKAIINLGYSDNLQATFNDGNGHWDNNGGKNYTFTSGTWVFDNGKIAYGEPGHNKAIVYYKKGFKTPYIHYCINGNWTQLPGVKMEDDLENLDYSKATIDLGNSYEFQAAFNDGAGNWYSNYGKNYTFQTGEWMFDNGKITYGKPPVVQLINTIRFEQSQYSLETNKDQIIYFNIYNSNGQAVPNNLCYVSVSGNAVVQDKVVTDSNGTGIIKISDKNEENVVLNVEMPSGAKATVSITFVKPIQEPKVICSEKTQYNFECDKEQTVAFSVYDASGNVIPKTACKITVSGSAIADNDVVTAENGVGTIKISDKNEEDVVLNIETLNGVNAVVPISFKKPIQESKVISTEKSQYNFECDKEQTVAFSVYDASGNVIPKTACKITVSGSAIADNDVVTAENGVGIIKISDKNEEDVVLNIETSNGVKVAVPISFKKLILQAGAIYTECPQYYFECDKDQTVSFCVYDNSDNIIPKAECKVTVNGNAVTDGKVITGDDGIGTIKISDKNEEDVVLNIETSKGIKTTVPISFVKPIPPAKPEIKLTKENGDIILRWDNVKDADYYEVKRKTNDGEYVKVEGNLDDGFYADGDLESGNKYSYIVNAVNEFGTSEDSNEGSTGYTTEMDDLGRLTADKATAFTNEATPATFHIKLGNKIAELNGVQLIDGDSTDKKVIATMYDDGNADNGDDVKGDGIYSCKININEAQRKDIHFKAYVSTDIDDSMKDLYSENTFELNVVPKLTNEDAMNSQTAINDITNNYKELIENKSNSLDTVAQKTLENIKANSYVADAGFSQGTKTIWYVLKSGIKCVIPITVEGTNGSGSATTLSFDYTNLNSTSSIYQNIADEFSKNGYSSKLFEDGKVSLDSFKNLSSNNIIVVNCHGQLCGDQPYICSGESVNLISMAANCADLLTGKLTIDITENGSYFGVLPDYIKTYNTSLNNSVIFLGSCQGLANENMWNAFKDLGASTIFGFDNDVYKDYAAGSAKIIFQSMINDGTTTGEAYNNAIDIMKDNDNLWKGVNVKEPAHLTMYGDAYATLTSDRKSKDLVNGDFESGFDSWTISGDVKVASELGDIKPTSGSNMAVIRDSADSFIEQRIYVPKDTTIISFDCYGVCEEPVRLALNKDYENGMEFELINDDNGDVSDTGAYSWQNSINVHNYQGQYLTLRFHVPSSSKSGESQKTLIIDNVNINGTPSNNSDDGNNNQNEDDGVDDKDYLTWPTDSTKIIYSDSAKVGIDIQGEKGDDAYAGEDGEVVFAGQKDGKNVVIINSEHDGKNIQTRYSNLGSLKVETGDFVFAGDSLGQLGDDGILHFEVLESKDGNECVEDDSNIAVNPKDYLFPYDEVEGIEADENLDVMGNKSSNTGLPNGYVYLSNIIKRYSDIIEVIFKDGNNKVTISMHGHTAKGVTFVVNAKHNKAIKVGTAVAINVEDFMKNFFPSTKFPGNIDVKKNLNVTSNKVLSQSVLKVQIKLNKLNYVGTDGKPLNVNGVCDNDLLKALKDFKKINKITNTKNDGIIDKKTWTKLFKGGKEYKETSNFVTATQLEKFGWSDTSNSFVKKLNDTLVQYGIKDKKNISIFMATMAAESDWGRFTLEQGTEEYFEMNGYTKNTRGAGYIQITYANTNLKFLKTMKDSYSGDDTATYIANNYPMEASAWYWSKMPKIAGKTLNEYVHKNSDNLAIFLITQYYVNGVPKGIDDDLTSIRKGGSFTITKDKKGKSVSLSVNDHTYKLPNNWDEREDAYNKAIKAFGN